MPPSFEATEFTAAPYLGNGPGGPVENVIRTCDHGYKEGFGLDAMGWATGVFPLRN